MGSTDPTKIRRAEIAPAAVSLLDFRSGPAPRLGHYAVWHVEAGCVRLSAIEDGSLEAIALRDAVPITPLPDALEVLVRFARGEPVDVASAPVVLSGPPFFVKIWTALRAVPRGEVCTYAHLARAARSPRAMRAVGQAMAKNPLPLVVPCHRVIADHARLGGYTGGTDRKRALLALEGVEVDGDTVRPGQLELLDRVARPR
jgi:methylated-DNA-[protein]-cysteine S-methyltransferase